MSPTIHLLAALACIGCGRIAFDPSSGTDPTLLDATPSITSDGAGDPGRAGPCLRAATLPTSATISGETFYYTDFANNTMAIGTAIVAALDENATMIAMGVSDISGRYALPIPLQGAPRTASLLYGRSGYWSTWIVTDRPFDRDVMGPNTMHWRLGDGPLWSDGAMASVYSTLGATIEPEKAFLSVSARDCAGEIIEGVSFEITPAPTTFAYLGADGLPAMSATSTLAPFGQLVAFNVEPGFTRIRASKPGLQFNDLDVFVLSGTTAMYTVVHAFD